MKIKAVIFDFDGTLTKNEKEAGTWYLVWDAYNDTETEKRYFDIFLDKKITTEEWFVLINARFKKLGVTKEVLKTASKIKMIDGIKETFDSLSSNKIKIIILTSGIINMVEAALKPETDCITQICGGITLDFDNDGKFLKFIMPETDSERKIEGINKIIKQFKLLPEEIVFVGNDYNDETVKQSGVETWCINPNNTDITNKEFWDYGIAECKNLQEILLFIK